MLVPLFLCNVNHTRALIGSCLQVTSHRAKIRDPWKAYPFLSWNVLDVVSITGPAITFTIRDDQVPILAGVCAWHMLECQYWRQYARGKCSTANTCGSMRMPQLWTCFPRSWTMRETVAIIDRWWRWLYFMTLSLSRIRWENAVLEG